MNRRSQNNLISTRYYSVKYSGPTAEDLASEIPQKYQKKRTTDSDYIPEQMPEESEPKTVDASLHKITSTEEVAFDDPALLQTRYRGFSPIGEVPSDMSLYEPLERQALEVLLEASKARDVHVIRELSTQAREMYERYLQETNFHGATPSVAFHLGLACGLLKDFSSQIECMLYTLSVDDTIVPAKKYLADAFQALNKHMEAVHYYDEYFNDFPRYYSRLVDDQGNMKTEGGDSINLNSEMMLADVVFSRGRSYFAMGKYGIDAAKEDFKAVIRLGSKHKANALYFMGLAESQGKDYWKAIKYFDLSLKTGPATWMMYKGRSDAWRALGKEDRADEDERHADVLKRQLHFSHQVESTVREEPPEFNVDEYLQPSRVLRPEDISKSQQ